MRANEFITEVFQQVKTNWEWARLGRDEASAFFNVGNREYLWQAWIPGSNPKKWEIQFRLIRKPDVDPDDLDLFGSTSTGNEIEVFSTAVDIIRAFLQKYGLDNVEEITFNAKPDPKNDPNNRRASMYDRMIKRLLPGWDLHKRYDSVDGMQFTLTDRRAYDRPENKLSETINPDILSTKFFHQQQIGDYIYTARTFKNRQGRVSFVITCYHSGIVKPAFVAGFAEFMIHTKKSEQWLESNNTHVEKDYRGANIASTMYAYAKMLGNDIKPSTIQLQPGKQMWKAWKKSGEAEHLVK